MTATDTTHVDTPDDPEQPVERGAAGSTNSATTTCRSMRRCRAGVRHAHCSARC